MRELRQLDNAVQKKKESVTGKTGTVSVSYRTFYAACLIFLTLPVIIFCLGYLRPLIGITLMLCFAGMCVMSIMECMSGPEGNKLEKQANMIDVPVKFLILFAITAVAVSLITGVGEYVFTLHRLDELWNEVKAEEKN